MQAVKKPYGFGCANPERSNDVPEGLTAQVWNAYKGGVPLAILGEMYPEYASAILNLRKMNKLNIFHFTVRNPANGEVYDVGSRKAFPEWFTTMCKHTKNPRRYMVK